MKKIVLVTSSYPIRPMETFNAGGFARDLALTLQNLGHPVWVITPDKGVPISDPDLRVVGFPWWRPAPELATLPPGAGTSLRLASLLLSGTFCLIKSARNLRSDHILALWAIPSGLLAYSAKCVLGTPYSVWALGSDIWARRRYPMGDQLVRKVLRHASFRFADSPGLAEQVRQLCGADCEFLPSTRRLPLEASPAGLPPGLNFLFVGRFEYAKGPDILVEAIKLLNIRSQKIHFHLIGDGSLMPLVQRRISELGLSSVVTLYGYCSVDKVVSMMKSCDYLVVPSRIESIPLVVSDAIKCCLPLVVTNVGDMGRLVRRWKIGFVADSPTPAEVARAIDIALQMDKARFLDNIKVVQSLFDIGLVGERVSELIEYGATRPARIPVGLLE